MIPSTRKILVAAAACLAGWQGACSGAGPNGAEGPDGAASARRDTEIIHEECDIADDDAVRVHADKNGRPAIVRVVDGGREICRAVDINRDSLIDVFVYFDENGLERRREYGFDRDNRPDEIDLFEGGKLATKMRETNNDDKIDTWDFYQNGQLVREERDSSGDGYVDQWWTFPQPDNPKCAVVVSDLDGDGKADEESRVDLCADETAFPVPPPADKAAKPTGTTAGDSTAPATETENASKPAGPSDGTSTAPAGDGPARP